jgi:hypothetical protein
LTVSRNYGIIISEQGKENPPNQKEGIIMKTVSIIKLSKGYYVEKRLSCNVTREWRKSKTAAEALKKKWEAE